ncbi:MAG: ABC transporter substrate-binding protein [Chloroflexi bacterium]|nr:ABC transporter substrate-binding protein [Chloroflexota bacterium]
MKRMITHKLPGMIVLLVLLGSSVLAACQPAASETAAPAAGAEASAATGAETTAEPVTITIADALQPSSLDIATEYEAAAMAVNRVVYERLVRYQGDTTEVEPELATSWEESEDGLEWTFHLREGVKFQDGTPFNAEAVKFSYDRVMTINQGPAWMFSKIDHIEAVDDNTVKFVLTEPFSSFLPVLANIWGTGIVSPKVIQDNETNDDLAQEYMQNHMVGTGPYSFVEWVHGDHITLQRNLDYWGGWDESKGQPIDRVIIKFITESATQRLQLEQGDLDIAMNISVDDLADVSSEDGISLVENPSLMGTYIRFNVQKPPLDNPKVREAIRLALDYDALINQVMLGHAIQMQGPASIGLPGHNDNLPVVKQDLDKARQLLEEAGVTTPLTLEYVYETGQEDRRMAGELLQANLADLGITLEIHSLPWETIWARVSSDDKTQTPDLTANGWWPDYAAVENFLYPMYHSSQWPPNSLNIGFYKNEEVDKLLDQALAEPDEATRNGLYEQAQELIFNDVPDIDLYQKSMTVMIRDWVKGYVYNPIYTEGFNLYDMRIDKAAQ